MTTSDQHANTISAVLLTDGSAAAAYAADAAQSLLTGDVTWRLATVTGPHPGLLTGATGFASPILSADEIEALDVERRGAAADAVAATTSTFSAPIIEAVLFSGGGAAPVAEFVDSEGVDLIVIPSPLALVGSDHTRADLLDDLMKSATVPLLVVPMDVPVQDEQPGGAPHRDVGAPVTVLIAVDDTGLDEQVVATALDVLGRGNAPTDLRCVLIHVAPSRTAIMSIPLAAGLFAGYSGATLANVTQQVGDDARAGGLTAERISDELDVGDAAHVTAEHVGEAGDPTAGILAAAQEHAADLIVVGTRNRSWFSRLFDPSVADAVTSQARRPVLVVRSALSEPD